jgi:sarcosine oxidase subunit delta
MRIDCPHCGSRPVDEFSVYGAAGHARPEGSTELSAWVDYVYKRRNSAGMHEELFHHVSGCRQWLSVTRDTRTHAISSVVSVRGRK